MPKSEDKIVLRGADFIKAVGEILDRGNTAEIKRRKSDIIVLEQRQNRKICLEIPCESDKS